MKYPGLLLLLFFCMSLRSQDYKKINELKQAILSLPNDTSGISKLIDYISDKQNHVAKDSVINYCVLIYNASSRSKFERGTGYASLNLGTHYNALGNYNKALTYLFGAEKAFKHLKSHKSLATVYNVIGNAYIGLNNVAGQKSYFSKCYAIGLQEKLPTFQAFGAGGLANYFIATKNFRESIKWNTIAGKLFLNEKRYVGYVITLTNIATSYHKLGDLLKAEEFVSLAEKNLPLAKFKYASFVCYKEKGDISTTKSEFSAAINYYTLALNLMLEDKANHNISEVYKSLSDVAYKAKLYKESADYLRSHLQYKDSVFNETSNRQILDVQEKYETEKKNSEIQLLNRQNDLNTSELGRKKVLIYSVVAVIILLLVLFIFVIKSIIRKNKTNTLLENQKIIIEEKQKEIVDSIHYAKRIQSALLANKEFMDAHVSQNFVLFEPKDIVSGDFYWATEYNDKFYLAVCDSTGHGVPGAFMSLLIMGFLNEAIKEKKIDKPNNIFNYVRDRLEASISKEGQKDGMDGILICYDKSTSSIEYAAANNTPILVRNNAIVELHKDRMPVGEGERKQDFTLFTIDISPGDMLYLYTDGYADQFGGAKGKKFKYKQLNDLLITINNKSSAEQSIILQDTLKNWQGNLEQVDDVCIIGIKL